MKKKALIIAFAAMLGCGTNAQLVSLSNDGKGPFWVDLDRVYNYNQYEKSRWGLGLRYGYTADELKNKRLWYNRLMAGAYIGYGYADQRFKWGVDAGYWTDLKHQGKVYAAYFHDLTAEATRSLNTYSLVNFNATGSFMNHFFSDTRRLTAGYSMNPMRSLKAGLELRLSDERKLHDLAYIYYPQSEDEWDLMEHARFAEGRLFFEHDCGLRGEVILGRTTGEWWVDSGIFTRVLLQYDQVFPVSKLFDFQVYAQGGITTKGTTFSRIFNLGGTSGSPLLFERSLLTARQDEFLANRFVLTCLRFGFAKPLFTYKSDFLQVGTAPRPFVLLDAAWGDMWDFQNIGPDKGIAEVGAGIDGLLRWGQVDWGLALAYRLTPTDTYYHLTETSDNITLVFTAVLNL